MPVPVVSEATFEREVLQSELPVLVDFYADWCGPCKTMAPEVDAIATELEGKAKVVKINIDESKRIATAMRIQSVPTSVVFFQGRPVAAQPGALKRNKLREMIEPFLPRAEGAVTAKELFQAIRTGAAIAPVDIREAPAFGRAHLPGAISMPAEGDNGIETRLAELHMLPGEPLLYCRSGAQSKALAEKLAASGIPVAFLDGGLLAWEAEGFEVERP